MNYSNTSSMCRIDFFKEGGKWYTTEEVKMIYYGTEEEFEGRKLLLLPEIIIASLRADSSFRMEDGRMRYAGMWAVVLEPWHVHSHPQMFKVPERWDP